MTGFGDDGSVPVRFDTIRFGSFFFYDGHHLARGVAWLEIEVAVSFIASSV